MATSDRSRAQTSLYSTHVLQGDLPFGSFWETDHNFEVASPLFTLLTVAGKLSKERLLMLMYEFCGSFTVFEPCAHTEHLLKEAYAQGMIPLGAGWQRVKDVNGKPTNLWRRDPLLDLDEVRDFSRHIDGRHGAKKFRWAAEHITGICASPFEVQASMLLGLPRRCGGMGLPIANNLRIPLTRQARKLYRYANCYADILIDAADGHSVIDIECQGRSVHGSEMASLSDSDRISALECMGINVLPLTYRQFADEDSFGATKQLIAGKLGVPLRPKTPAQQTVESNLRSEVLVSWADVLG